MGRIGLPELFIIVFSLALYFLPTIIGHKKGNAKSIFILNLLLGWTFIGWIVALIWAVAKDKETVIINNPIVSKSTTDELIKLRELLDNGTITEKEFEIEKSRVLK